MNAPAALRAAFPASSHRLLDVARRAVDDSMLRVIADADYGIGAIDYLHALRAIRDTGAVSPALASWDVLKLTVFSQPNGESRDSGSSDERGHRMRVFACAVILQGEFEGYGQGMAETALGQCLVSARGLGDELNAAIGSYLNCALPSVCDADRWLFALALLIVASRTRFGELAESDLGEAAAWVLAEESVSRRQSPPSRPPPFGVQHGFWSPLGADLVDRAAVVKSSAIRDHLELLGRFILGAV